METADDNFNLTLPLPFRLALLIVFGTWLWAINLHILYLAGIKVPELINYPSRPSADYKTHHATVYALAKSQTIPIVIGLAFFWIATHNTHTFQHGYAWIPNVYLAFLALSFVIPVLPAQKGRQRLLSTLGRISIGGLAHHGKGKFGDVLLADTLTSYSKPISEVFVLLCTALTGESTMKKPNRDCGRLAVPFFVCYPFLIRSRQCYTERQWFNLLKYATSIVVIMLSTMVKPDETFGLAWSPGFLWMIAVAVNSLYSFYWDVAQDWDLTEENRPKKFHKLVYWTAVVIDFFLRIAWSIKISTVAPYGDMETGIFVLQILEILRRWMWIFLRVETEQKREERKEKTIPL